ncbi:unnamed protein product [Calypogeia fissa]
MGSFNKNNAGGSPKWYGKLFGNGKVSSSDDVPNSNAVVQPASKKSSRSASKSPPLVVNYFPSGQGLLRL